MAIGDQGKGGVKGHITITVVVGGNPVTVNTSENAPLHAVIGQALALSGNVGQNPDEWEIADKAGTPYDPNKTFDELGLKNSSTIYLSRKAGGGG